MDGMNSEDIKLVSTEDLVQELLSRCDHGIIGIMRPAKKGNGYNTFKLRWRGDGFRCAGLASAIQEEINRYRIDNEDKIDPEQF